MGKLRKKYSIEDFSQISTQDIIEDMSNAHYSLLRSFGLGYLNFVFFWVRLACHFFLNMASLRARYYVKKFHLNKKAALKKALGQIFERGAPWIIDPRFPSIDYDCGLVIGFNHPSLGEIIRLMGICMLTYDQKRYLFPVNLIWFEALAPVIHRLREFGFELMPIITPSAKDTLLKHAKGPGTTRHIERLAHGFIKAYILRSAEFVARRQIVLVAPSARRNLYVFKDKETWEGKKPVEPQTMSALVNRLLSQEQNFLVLPVAVMPPKGASRGLNLLAKYLISPCPVSRRDLCDQMLRQREVYCNSRRFERFFLEVIALRLEERGARYMRYEDSD